MKRILLFVCPALLLLLTAAVVLPRGVDRADLIVHEWGTFTSIAGEDGKAVQWRTYHSLQLSLNRRLIRGVALGFTDTIGLYDHQQANLRLLHTTNGIAVRDDQGAVRDWLVVGAGVNGGVAQQERLLDPRRAGRGRAVVGPAGREQAQ